MAKLPSVVDSLDAIPETGRDYYTQTEGGKFVLDADVEAHPAISGLKTKNQELIRREKELALKLKEFEGMGMTAAEAKALAEERQKSEEEKQRRTGDEDARIKQLQDAHAKKEKEWQDRDAKRIASLDKKTRHSDAKAAIQANDGKEKWLLPYVLEQTRTVEEGDEVTTIAIDKKGNTRYSPLTGEPMTVNELVAEMRGIDEYKDAFNAPAVTGSGAPPSQRRGGNGDIVLSKDQQKDPAAYRRAKEEAAKRGVQVIFA